jgi:class 3 adenylate cyclase
MIFAFVLLGLQFRNACLIGFSLFAAFVGLLAVYTSLGSAGIWYRLYHLVTLVALIVFLSYAREWFIRRDFASQAALAAERERSERLLYNTLPRAIAERMKSGERPIADVLPEVTVLFADLVGFTPMAARIGPDAVVRFLNALFSEFDRLVEHHGLEKVKTIGDAYMVISQGAEVGTQASRKQAVATSRLGLAMIDIARDLASREGRNVDIRVGIHMGPAVAGVIGETKFQYDVWGDTVNVASRLEATGVPGRVQVSEAVRERIAGEVATEPRDTIELKGRGAMQTYLLRNKG